MRAARILGALALAALSTFVDAGVGAAQDVPPPEVATAKQGAAPELFPAQLVASQIRAALADPRNAEHLAEAERLVGLAASAEPGLPAAGPIGIEPTAEGFVPPEPEPSLEAITPLAARVEDSRNRISELATQAREALPVGPELTALGAPWMPWVAVGLLLVLFVLSRVLSKPSEHRSLRTARKLAGRGIVAGEVARRTGLSQDVIHLIKQRSKGREPREVA